MPPAAGQARLLEQQGPRPEAGHWPRGFVVRPCLLLLDCYLPQVTVLTRSCPVLHSCYLQQRAVLRAVSVQLCCACVLHLHGQQAVLSL